MNKKQITLEIEALNPIDMQTKINYLNDLAKLNQEDLKLLHELATTPKYLTSLKKNEKMLRGLAKIM